MSKNIKNKNNNNKILISFIIPSFHSEKYIEDCILSIINQETKINFEIIILDASRNNKTIKKISTFINNDKNMIKIFKIAHKGVSYSRNIGIKKSKGEYITFIDSDDLLGKNFFDNFKKIENIEKYDVIKTVVKVIENKEYDFRFDLPIFEELKGIEALKLFASTNKIFATPWSYILKRKYIINNNLYFKHNLFHEDQLLMPFVLAKAESVKSVEWIGYNYIKRKNSLSTSNDFDNEFNRINDFISNSEILIKNFDDPILGQYFKQRLKIKIDNLPTVVKLELNYNKINELINYK